MSVRTKRTGFYEVAHILMLLLLEKGSFKIEKKEDLNDRIQ